MTTLSELRACKSCGNVFTKRAGVTIISSCPQCDGTNFDTINVDEGLVQEKIMNIFTIPFPF